MIIDGFGGKEDQGYFAIYDGHGGRGAVDFTAKNLHKVCPQKGLCYFDEGERERESFFFFFFYKKIKVFFLY